MTSWEKHKATEPNLIYKKAYDWLVMAALDNGPIPRTDFFGGEGCCLACAVRADNCWCDECNCKQCYWYNVYGFSSGRKCEVAEYAGHPTKRKLIEKHWEE